LGYTRHDKNLSLQINEQNHKLTQEAIYLELGRFHQLCINAITLFQKITPSAKKNLNGYVVSEIVWKRNNE
jgi:hypothetical protein